MSSLTKRHARHLLPIIGLSLSLALAGCSTASTTSHATVISETVAAQPSNPPTASIPATVAAQSSATSTTALQPTPAPSNQAPSIVTIAQTTSVAPPTQVNAAPAGAVQTVLNYYDAINQGNYDQAYQYWANAGAASHQSFDQFKQGFAKTVQVSVQAGDPTKQADGSVKVPLMLLSVVNEPVDATHTQQVQEFNGSYQVQATGNRWELASANITAGSGPVQLPAALSDPLKLVHAYYDAINRREFAQAYTYWGDVGTSSHQTFSQFQDGFAATDHVVIELGTPQGGAAAGSSYTTVPLVIVATHTDQSQHTFCGSYVLRRANVPPFDQFGWHIDQAKIAPTGNVQLGSDQAKQLLNGGCK